MVKFTNQRARLETIDIFSSFSLLFADNCKIYNYIFPKYSREGNKLFPAYGDKRVG
jgi:hypothetical protein